MYQYSRQSSTYRFVLICFYGIVPAFINNCLLKMRYHIIYEPNTCCSGLWKELCNITYISSMFHAGITTDKIQSNYEIHSDRFI